MMFVPGMSGVGRLLPLVVGAGFILSIIMIIATATGRRHVMTIDDAYLVLTDMASGEERHRVPRGQLAVERLQYVGPRGGGDAVRISGPSMPAFIIGCNTGRGGVGRRIRTINYAFSLTDWERLRRVLSF
jgi:hypothetical protein